MTIEITVTSKGQVTLKKSLLEHLGVKPGEKLNVLLRGDGKLELEQARPSGTIMDLAGLLYRPGERTLTVEEMDDAIAEAVTAEYQRSVS